MSQEPRFRAGQYVVCVRGDERVGLEEGMVYAVGAVFTAIQVMPDDIRRITGANPYRDRAIFIELMAPKVTVQGLPPYLLDEDRFAPGE